MLKKTKKRRKIDMPATDGHDLTVGVFFAPEGVDVSLEQFEDALRINEDQLNEALEEQPDLVYRVSQVLALQISRRDAAKQWLANQEAVIDAQLRRTSALGKERVTDKAIEAQRRVSVNVVNATNQLLRMEHSVRQWQNLKEAFIQRGHALRELVALYVNNYYAAGGSVTMRNASMDMVREHYKRKGT